MPPIQQGKGILVAFRGTPQQNVVAFLFDPHSPR
jgi:hypothetical protein